MQGLMDSFRVPPAAHKNYRSIFLVKSRKQLGTPPPTQHCTSQRETLLTGTEMPPKMTPERRSQIGGEFGGIGRQVAKRLSAYTGQSTSTAQFLWIHKKQTLPGTAAQCQIVHCCAVHFHCWLGGGVPSCLLLFTKNMDP